MQAREITRADGLQNRGCSPGEVVARQQRGRSPQRNREPSEPAVYRFLSGSAYTRGQTEARGRKLVLPSGILGAANAERMVLKAAGSNYSVTWEDFRKSTQAVLKCKGRLSRSRRTNAR